MTRTLRSTNLLIGIALAATVGMLLSLAAPALAADAPPAAVPAAVMPAAKALPGDCFLCITVRNVNELREHFKQTTFWALYKDPAMQEFVVPAEKKVTELVEEKLKEMWKEAGIENPPESIPWPEGAVTFAMRLERVKRTVPKYDWSGENGPKVVGQEEITVSEPRIVAMVDFGANIDKVKGIVTQATAKAVEKGAKRTQESVRGLDIEVFTPPAPKPPAAGADAPAMPPPPTPEPTVLALKDRTYLISNDLKLMNDVAARLGGAEQESLADDAGYKKVMGKLAADQSDLAVYLNVRKLIQSALEGETDAKNREEMQKIMTALGVDGVSGVGAVLTVAANPKENMRLKILAGVDGPKRGLVELLAPAGRSTKPGTLLTKDLAGFVVLNYDPGKIFDQAMKMVEACTGKNPEPDINEAMKHVSGGEENAPPLSLRKDILGPMAGPITILTRLTKPYTDPHCQKLGFAIGVRDGAVLDKALARIHGTITAGAPAEMRAKLKQELLNCTIYAMPGMNPLGLIMGMGMGAAPGAEEGWPALAVVGDQLVLGTLESVRQAVRDTKKDKAQVESIAADPMYDLAAKFFPDQAVMVMYGNQQVSAEVLWTQVKETAKTERTKPKTEGEDEPDLMPSSPAEAFNPMAMIVKQFKSYCDFTSLPDFAKVKQYFGVEAGYLTGTDEGIYLESVNLKPAEK